MTLIDYIKREFAKQVEIDAAQDRARNDLAAEIAKKRAARARYTGYRLSEFELRNVRPVRY